MHSLFDLIQSQFALILFIAALLTAAFGKGARYRGAESYLAWLLLLSVGVQGIWAAAGHLLVPERSASYIGWSVSPFQFEMGMADLAIGSVAIYSYWRSLDFKAAIVGLVTIVYWGVAIGHIHQALAADNYSAGNAGTMLLVTIVEPILLMWFLQAARREQASRPRAVSPRGSNTPARA